MSNLETTAQAAELTFSTEDTGAIRLEVRVPEILYGDVTHASKVFNGSVSSKGLLLAQFKVSTSLDSWQSFPPVQVMHGDERKALTVLADLVLAARGFSVTA